MVDTVRDAQLYKDAWAERAEVKWVGLRIVVICMDEAWVDLQYHTRAV